MGWLIATTQKTVAFHAVRCVNPLVALIGKITNSVRGWILTGFAKARLAYVIGVSAGARTISSAVSGIGGRTMDDLILRAAAIEAIISLTAFESEDELKRFVEEKACDDYYLGGLCDVIDEIKDTAAVDAVPVIRCQDCLYFCDMSDMGKGYQCSYHSVMGPDGEIENMFYTAPEAYCAWGERRDKDA